MTVALYNPPEPMTNVSINIKCNTKLDTTNLAFGIVGIGISSCLKVGCSAFVRATSNQLT